MGQRLEPPVNRNYCGTVVKVGKVRKLENCDNVGAASFFGFQVIVGKDSEGELGVFFPAETQLSHEYCRHNNLYRKKELNADPSVAGYIEENRRVKAVKFRGNVSNGLFMPINSLWQFDASLDCLTEGAEFDRIGEHEICRKYVVPVKESRCSNQKPKERGFVRVDAKMFPEHIDTENFMRNAHRIPNGTPVIVTQKLHGTSIRIGRTLTNRKLGFIERIARALGAKVAETEYADVCGSRKVIKDAGLKQNHYYGSDVWTAYSEKLKGKIPDGYVLYGELVGYTPEGEPIQRGYTYGHHVGTCELYVYRVAIVNGSGLSVDLSWDAVKEFCNGYGIRHVPEMFRCKAGDLKKQDFACVRALLDCRYRDGVAGELPKKMAFANEDMVWLGENSETVDEGICVRIDGMTPQIFKAKSPKFLEHETKLLDTGEEDLESTQTN